MGYTPYRDLFTLLEEREDDDLKRLIWILETIPGDKLIEKLEEERRGRRNKNPVRTMWYCAVAATLYTRGRINPLISELKRNENLRVVCHIPCVQKIPSRDAFKRFRGKLAENGELLKEMFDLLVEKLGEEIVGLGKVIAIDSTGIRTYRRAKDEEEDGSYGKKRTTQIASDGTEEEVLLEWFGFKLHLVVDAATEIPLAYRVTKAGCADTTQMMPLVKEIREKHPETGVEVVVADKGYDDSKNHQGLWAEKIKGVIPKRQEAEIHEDTLSYNDGSGRWDLELGEDGGLECWARIREHGKWVDRSIAMSPTGFEADRCSVKFRCPAVHNGLHCTRSKECNAGKSHGRVVRVPCATDWRRVSPILTGTPKWERLYKKRTSVERCFGRLKNVLGLGELAVWTKSRVEVQMHLGILILTASAAWHVSQGRQTNLNRLTAARLAA
jgi:hypothetical protein